MTADFLSLPLLSLWLWANHLSVPRVCSGEVKIALAWCVEDSNKLRFRNCSHSDRGGNPELAGNYQTDKTALLGWGCTSAYVNAERCGQAGNSVLLAKWDLHCLSVVSQECNPIFAWYLPWTWEFLPAASSCLEQWWSWLSCYVSGT